MRDDITPRQREVLGHISIFMEAKGFAPSLREICVLVGVSSTNVVAEYLDDLEKYGYIQRTPRIARSLKILKKPKKEVVT
jgi:repressor LexA